MSYLLKAQEQLQQGQYQQAIDCLYPIGAKYQPDRYIALIDGFGTTFGEPETPLRLFSSPGRTEIGGNHTDHQQGKVLAAAVHLDIGAVVEKTEGKEISLFSEGYGLVTISLESLSIKEEEVNTTQALIRGICYRMEELGYKVGGFKAYSDSQVPVGSGLSSSAAVENLITTILNYLYNDGQIAPIEIAKIGQYAENEFFGKPSGLLDQGTSACGSMITIDFQEKEAPVVKEIQFDPAEYEHTLCIVNTGGDHADLTDEYAAIFSELQEISHYFSKNVLREVPFDKFYQALPELRILFGERPLIRAFHIYEENHRVEQEIAAIEKKDFSKFKEIVKESGISSFTQLQNVFSPNTPVQQPLSLGLSVSQHLLQPVDGAWRVHGGGFAGTIQAYVPNEYLGTYRKEMNRIFGDNACQPLAIRSIGSTEIWLNK